MQRESDKRRAPEIHRPVGKKNRADGEQGESSPRFATAGLRTAGTNRRARVVSAETDADYAMYLRNLEYAPEDGSSIGYVPLADRQELGPGVEDDEESEEESEDDEDEEEEEEEGEEDDKESEEEESEEEEDDEDYVASDA